MRVGVDIGEAEPQPRAMSLSPNALSLKGAFGVVQDLRDHLTHLSEIQTGAGLTCYHTAEQCDQSWD